MISKYILPICIFIFGAVFEIQAYTPRPELEFSAGWRQDKVQQIVNIHMPPSAPSSHFDHITTKNINVWQLGVEGTWRLPYFWDGCYFDRDLWWLNQFYLRGYAYWGTTDSGHWEETFNDIPPPANTLPGIEIGKIHHGYTGNYEIAVGWLYPVFDGCNQFGIGPVAGWGFDYIKFKVHHLRNPPDSSNTDPAIFNGEAYKSWFEGPFAGLDIRFLRSDILFSIGYEYHWVMKWRGSLQYPTEAIELGAISTHGSAKTGCGNVVYFNADWQFCDDFEFGIGFKYYYFKTNKGHQEPDGGFADNHLPTNQVDRLMAKWYSYGIQLNLGYMF